ncbi:ROK family transcriptional regulator [Sphingomonas crusticola]|uniref:ROK family transcriptional regulator n=1 Tax=Sphingomonas crusticola TaxID=1697973 RepID=UPI001F07CE53|nr:ROK family transcriptional regulator [Sphingomonas crusticola]
MASAIRTAVSAHGGTIGADDRGTRLAGSLSGTNLERAADYNQRIVLQAIRISDETTRSDLASLTGLTPPTIANITRRLLDLGLIVEAGRRFGMRGQPALRLRVNPDGCFSIGINIDRDHYTIVTLDLAGNVRTRAVKEISFAMPEHVLSCLRAEVAAIRASGAIDEKRLIGVGVALPDDLGSVALPHRPEGYEVWNHLDVAGLVREVLPLPVHIDNDAAAAAIGEAQFGSGLTQPSFFYVLISAGLGGGMVMDGTYVRGATARSGEIGFLPDPSASRAGATVQDTVSLSALLARIEEAGGATDDIEALSEDMPVVRRWLDDATRSLTNPLVAVNCLVNPAAVLIGGRLPEPLIDALVARLNSALDKVPMPAIAPVLRAATSGDAPAIGAAILPFLDRVLPTESALMQAGRS